MTDKNKKEHDKLQDLTKARGVFFQNYDLYDTGDPSPGTGLYQHMDEYDSVADFRNKKRKEKIRKRRKAMFEAQMVSTAKEVSDLKLNKIFEMLNRLAQLKKNPDMGQGFYDKNINDKAKVDDNDLADPEDGELPVTPLVWNPAVPGGSPIGILDGAYQNEDLDGTPVGNLYYGETEMHRIDS